VVHRSLTLGTADDVEPYARAYRGLVESLAAGTLDLDAAAGADRMNELIGAPTERPPGLPLPE
jgi:hypothetical protein